jgi:hypothetical protein
VSTFANMPLYTLHPRLQDGNHPNLHALVQSRAVKVVFDEKKRGTSVVYTPTQSAKLRIKNSAVNADLSAYNFTSLNIVDVNIISRNSGSHTDNIAMFIGGKDAESPIVELRLSANWLCNFRSWLRATCSSFVFI